MRKGKVIEVGRSVKRQKCPSQETVRTLSSREAAGMEKNG